MEKIKNRIYAIFVAASLAVLLAVTGGCASKRGAGSDGAGITVKELRTLPAVKAGGGNLSAKLRINANLRGKEFSAGGNIKVKRGEGIQISINALGGLIEVARVEMTPEKMLLIYRLGREYAEARYDEIEALGRLGLDYPMLEAILLNELFMPDGGSVEKGLSKMDIRATNGEIVLSTLRAKGMQYSFGIEQGSGRLVLTRGDYENRVGVDCNYSDFAPLGGRDFPKRIRFSVASMTLDLALNNIKDGNFKLNGSTGLRSYKRVGLSELLKGIKF